MRSIRSQPLSVSARPSLTRVLPTRQAARRSGAKNKMFAGGIFDTSRDDDEEEDHHIIDDALDMDAKDRRFRYDSLNEHIFRLSLTHSCHQREWGDVTRILLGWGFNLSVFAFLLCIYIIYGCVFEQLSADDNSEAFFMSWMWSLAQRFLVFEPILILVGALLPMLFASQSCANMCSESVNTTLGIAFAVLITLAKRLRRF